MNIREESRIWRSTLAARAALCLPDFHIAAPRRHLLPFWVVLGSRGIRQPRALSFRPGATSPRDLVRSCLWSGPWKAAIPVERDTSNHNRGLASSGGAGRRYLPLPPYWLRSHSLYVQ